MDPSYEGHGDYGRVIASLRDALGRFAEGVYMVWYPQVPTPPVPRNTTAGTPADRFGSGSVSVTAVAVDGPPLVTVSW